MSLESVGKRSLQTGKLHRQIVSRTAQTRQGAKFWNARVNCFLSIGDVVEFDSFVDFF
jgi:hypothetical protein